MSIGDLFKKYYKIEIELLLANVLKKPKEFLFMNPGVRLTRIQTNRLTRMAQRRLRGEPMAYILGYKDFYGLRFKVNKNVLIPRPETEMVIDLVSAKLRSSPLLRGDVPSASEGQRGRSNRELTQPLPGPLLRRRGGFRGVSINILDVGTGSGCIAITIAKQLRIANCELKITAADISSAALKVAKQNAKIILAKHYHTTVYDSVWPKIKFVKSDLLKNINCDFDIIIANLPYGWSEWKNNSSAQTVGLKFEPRRALFTKEKGLMTIRRLLNQIADKKHKPKLMYLEFDPRQKTELSKLIKKSLPGSKVKFHKDYNNLWRWAEISLF
jgi:release factor glutamine methyltransferase